MRIFPRRFALRIYRSANLKELLPVIDSWADEVIYKDSPFLRQVAVYFLRRHGSSSAPRLFKQVLGNEILSVMGFDDVKACVLLAFVESYEKFDPLVGGSDLINWLSWKIPYETSKWVFWRRMRPIAPFEKAYIPGELEKFESESRKDMRTDIIANDLGLSRQEKYYYKSVMEENNGRFRSDE